MDPRTKILVMHYVHQKPIPQIAYECDRTQFEVKNIIDNYAKPGSNEFLTVPSKMNNLDEIGIYS